jgi:hypothetical protein
MKSRWTSFATGIFLVTIIAFVSPTDSNAAKVKSVTFTPVLVEIAPGHFDAVGASTKCPNGSVTPGGILSMNPSKTGASVSGSWHILQEEGAVTGPDGGTFTKLQVSKNKFNAKGDFITGDNNLGISLICQDAHIPAKVSFRGACGPDGIVILVASNGVTGSYKGNITCKQ